jgi:hypothetical protein
VRKLTVAIACTVALGGVAGFAAEYKSAPHPTDPLLRVTAKAPAERYIGAVTYNPAAFNRACRCRPNIAARYVRWGSPFSASAAQAIRRAGALPLFSWEPYNTSLASIVAGRSDSYVRQWAHAAAAYPHPIAITFGPEMNGSWEPWGPTHVTPVQFVAAWKHIHDLFKAVGAGNVTWVWTVNIITGLRVQIASYWPGSAYVDWVGMDGYWWGQRPARTFATTFDPTLVAVRAFTAKPVLITETAALPGWKMLAVRDLFAGMKNTPGVLGFLWFDIRNSYGDFRLEDDPAALAAFGKGVSRVLSNH